jgi:hypothetical protein
VRASASSSEQVPCARRAGCSNPSKKAPCSVKVSGVRLSSGVSPMVAGDTEIRD